MVKFLDSLFSYVWISTKPCITSEVHTLTSSFLKSVRVVQGIRLYSPPIPDLDCTVKGTGGAQSCKVWEGYRVETE
jgi:hypothetical protein